MRSRHIPARGATAGSGHDRRGGQACGRGYGVDFSLTTEQRELTEAAADFARRELNRDLMKREDAGEFPRDEWQACAKFGIQGLPIPAELGGAGSDVLTTALVMEALGYGCQDNGLLFSLNAQMWSVELPLVIFGTPAQQRAYLPGMVSGELIGAHAMTEPGSGSDALHMSTSAERRGDHYVLKGTKQYITNAPVADVLLVYASVKDRPGLPGLSAFLVSAATPGLAVSNSFEKMGLRTSPMGEVTLHDCLVPAESRLGPEGAGMAIFNSSMEWERSCLFASVLGAMRRQLEACVGYARSREQFGQPIGKFQGVSDKLADMYVRVEAARSLIYRVAWLKEQGRSAPAEAAAAKLFTSEAWVRSSQDAIQVHGAWGYLKDAGIERDLRDAVAGTIYSGTSEIQRVVIGRMLGL
jgi:alkylation response protein AidB-like acyl-CoA dehydrogenase